MRRRTVHAVALVAAASCLTQGAGRPAPRSIEALRKAQVKISLRHVRALDDGASFTARLVSYRSGLLTVHAMVATPKSPPPPRGYPVLVANHGTHPNPPRYGFGADGTDARPGDYYRPIPELYTSRGFMVVAPDYRGHNVSQGVEFARGFLASAYYTEDVLALLAGVPSLEGVDPNALFMWGHSLGAEVTLRAVLATGVIKGASLWSTVGGDIWEQAYYYSRYRDRKSIDGSDVAKSAIATLKQDIAGLGEPYDWAAREPWQHLRHLRTPLILHHAVGDEGAPYGWSERLAKELYVTGHAYVFHSYPGTDHLLQGKSQQQAADRDVQFFRSLMGR